MCGIFGFIHRSQIPTLKNFDIASILQHRGPDDAGWLLYDGNEVKTGKSSLPDIAAKLLLLHKRLAILDLTQHGWQPMSCNQERYYILFNGEIYNYLELKTELQNKGAVFRSKSDSEVLLNAYIYWGKSCLNKLVGMFAFAIFDREAGKIFCARDAFGIKPFYYFRDDQRIIFASEIKSLLSFLPKNKVNADRLFYYLRSGMTDFADETLFADIKQLPAGHMLEFDLGNLNVIGPTPYWQASFNTNHDISFSEAAAQLQKIFLNNVSLHLRSDVPVAATLSGGIDSSSIVMAIRNLHPNLDIHTFSYIADDQRLNEEKWIDIVNTEANAINHKVYANPHHLISDLEHLITNQDEPFGSTSIYAQQRVFEEARRAGIKVMLDGQGADEMLGGYTFYVSARFVSLIKKFKFNEALQLLCHSTNAGNLVLRSFSYLLPFSWQTSLRKMNGTSYIPDWLNPAWFEQSENRLFPFKKKYGKNVLHEELIHTLSHSSLPMLLRYEDRNSMSYSIESRVPFLTTEMVDFIFSLPEDFLISKQGVSKAVFREAMRGIVPQSILERRDKIGFATPEKNWLSTLKPWVENILMSDYAKHLPMFNHKKLLADWQQLLSGKSQFDFRYWRWINFIKWAEMHQVEF